MRLKRETQGAVCVLNAKRQITNAKIYEDKTWFVLYYTRYYCGMWFYAPEIKIGLEKDVIVHWYVYKEYARDGHDDMRAIIKTRTPQLGAD